VTATPRAPRGPARFTEADLKRAIRGAQKAKIPIAAVDIMPDGRIRVIPGKPEDVQLSAPSLFDEELGCNGRD